MMDIWGIVFFFMFGFLSYVFIYVRLVVIFMDKTHKPLLSSSEKIWLYSRPLNIGTPITVEEFMQHFGDFEESEEDSQNREHSESDDE